MKPFKPLLTDGKDRSFRIMERLYTVLRNGISFGDGINPDNIDCCFATANFTVANTNLTINHTLGRVAIGYIPYEKSAACDVYDGTIAGVVNQITLRGSTIALVHLILF